MTSEPSASQALTEAIGHYMNVVAAALLDEGLPVRAYRGRATYASWPSEIPGPTSTGTSASTRPSSGACTRTPRTWICTGRAPRVGACSR